MKTLSRVLACVTMLLVSPPLAHAQTTQETVDQFYPLSRLSPASAAERYSCFVVLSTAPDRTPTSIAAAYTDGNDAVLRVLTKNAGTFSINAESDASPRIMGRECSINQVDFTGDTNPELFASFSEGGTWVFGLGGGAITNLSPTITIGGGGVLSQLTGPVLCDVRHDGTIQICTGPDARHSDSSSVPERIFRTTGGPFILDRDALGIATFTISSRPVDFTTFGLLADAVAPFSIQVINGDRFGKHRVSAGSIAINGVEVVSSSMLIGAAEFVEAPISGSVLTKHNWMSVSISGDPGATITVIVKDSTIRPN